MDPYPSIGLDSQGRPQGVYYRADEGDLYYYVRTDAGWRQTAVDVDGDAGWYASLAVDHAGRPHVAYRYRTLAEDLTSELRYAVLDAAGWTIETVQTGANGQVALALDGSDRPHILTHSWPDRTLVFNQVGNGWQPEVVATQIGGSGQFQVWHPVLRWGDSGQAQAVFYNRERVSSPNPDLYEPFVYFAQRSGLTGTWSVEKVTKGEAPVLVGGNANAARLLFSYKMLLSTWILSGSWHFDAEIDQGGEPGRWSSLARDERDWLHVSTHDAGRSAYIYRRFAATGATQTVWDAIVMVTQRTALAVDGVGWPRLLVDSYQRWRNLALFKADAAGWAVEAVFTDTYPIARFYALAVGAGSNGQTVSHLAYSTTSGLAYITAPGDGTGRVLDAEGQPGALDLAVDGAGGPHIAYIATEAHVLRYAAVRKGKWFTETVAAVMAGANPDAQSVAIAIAPTGAPEIAFIDAAAQLALAIRDGRGWHVRMVDWMTANADLDLAAAGDGRTWISYYEPYNQDLRVACVISNAEPVIWVVDSVGNAGLGSSIVVDGQGTPHISYYDADRFDLKHAFLTLGAANHIFLPAAAR